MLKNSNSIVMEGNLVRDPVVVTTPTGSQVYKFSIAHNRYYTVNNEKRSEVSFFDVEVWNKTAAKCLDLLKKGKAVRVAGRLKQDRWLDDQGKQHSRVKIIGNDIQAFPQLSETKNLTENEDIDDEELVNF